ncbi:MAG: HEAT repeat domain-containing protein [candidate division WOR-3 bacterium]
MTEDKLIEDLLSSEPKVRFSALKRLKSLGVEKATEILVPLLGSDNQIVRDSAVATILALGKATISYLVGALNSPNEIVRMNVVRILGEIGDASISGELLGILKKGNSEVKASVIEVLGRIKEFWAVEYLRDFLKASEPLVRAASARALGELKDKLSIDLILSLLSDKEKQVRIAAIEALSKIGDTRACDSLWQIATNDVDFEVRNKAMLALKIIGSEVIKPHEEWLLSNDVNKRDLARLKLSSIGKPVILPLLEYTKHYEASVRELSARILGDIGDNIATPRLIELVNDIDDDVKLTAIGALGKIKSESAIRSLLSCLESPDSRVVDAATESLSKSGKELIKFLPSIISEHNIQKQLNIVQLIGKIGDVEFIPILSEYIDHPSLWVRMTVCLSLGELKSPLSADLLLRKLNDDPSPLVRAASAKAFGKLKIPEKVDALIWALQEEKEEIVQVAIINALGEIGEEIAGSFLVNYLFANDIEVKISAIKALGKIGYLGAISHLKKIIRPWPFSRETPEVKNAARQALNEISQESMFGKP